MAPVNQVTNYLVHLRNEDLDNGVNVSLTNLKMNKLLYFCHAMFAVNTNGNNLIEDANFQAWRYGPVIPEVYYRFNVYGQSEIPNNESGNFEELNELEIQSIDQVWNTLRDTSAYDLVQISHAEGGPWHNAYEEGLNNEIDNQEILAYFGGM